MSDRTGGGVKPTVELIRGGSDAGCWVSYCWCVPSFHAAFPRHVATAPTQAEAMDAAAQHYRDKHGCDCYPGGFTPATFEGPQEHCRAHGLGVRQ